MRTFPIPIRTPGKKSGQRKKQSLLAVNMTAGQDSSQTRGNNVMQKCPISAPKKALKAVSIICGLGALVFVFVSIGNLMDAINNGIAVNWSQTIICVIIASLLSYCSKVSLAMSIAGSRVLTNSRTCTKIKFLGAALALALTLMSSSAGAFDMNSGTKEQRQACMADTFQYCLSDTVDEIVTCLKTDPRVSPECKAVVNGGDQGKNH